MATKNKSFAQEARSITNRYKLRLGDKFDKGDTLALEAMNQELSALRERQEQARIDELSEDGKFCKGGKLPKRATGGMLPEYQGPGEYPNYLPLNTKPAYPYNQYFADAILDTDFGNMKYPSPYDLIQGRSPLSPLNRPTMLKGATITGTNPNVNPNPSIYRPNNFHLSLGNEPNMAMSLPGGTQGFFNANRVYDGGILDGVTISGNKVAVKPSTKKSTLPAVATPTPIDDSGIDPYDLDINNLDWNRVGDGSGLANRGLNTTPDTLPATSAEAMADQTGSAPVEGQSPFKSRVPWMGAAASAIGSILANRKLDLPEYEYEEYKPEQRAARLVDYSRAREQTLRERDLANAIIQRQARGRGSQAGLMETILAGTTGTQRQAGTEYGQSIEQQQNVNAQIRNQVAAENARMNIAAAQMNAQNKMYATQIERENAMIDAQRKSDQILGITDAFTGYMQDRQSANVYDQMMNMELGRNPNYGVTQADPTFWRRIAGITDPITEVNFRNTNDKG